jgi:hypothetical protein
MDAIHHSTKPIRFSSKNFVEVVFYQVGEQPIKVSVEKSTKMYGEMVDGEIEYFAIPGDMFVICAKQALGKQANRLVGNYLIHGDFIVVADGGSYGFVAPSEDQMKMLLTHIS